MLHRPRFVPFQPPAWAKHLVPPPNGRVALAHLPTPCVPWACPELHDLGIEWWIKRDDLTGAELTGNKARKLEFLMADALARKCDTVVTIGGLQSNHCRATAAAARLVGVSSSRSAKPTKNTQLFMLLEKHSFETVLFFL